MEKVTVAGSEPSASLQKTAELTPLAPAPRVVRFAWVHVPLEMLIV
jgi:hypothetical protein